jgi:hypothetical protein
MRKLSGVGFYCWSLKLSKTVPVGRWRALGYEAQRWALDNVHTNEARFIASVTSRQAGKSFAAAMEIDEAMSHKEDEFGVPVVGLIAPTYAHCDIVVNRYLEFLAKSFGADSFKYNQNKHIVTIVDPSAGTVGARLHWISADDPMYAMGYTFSKLLFDESQRVPDAVFIKARPTVAVRDGEIRAFGTPDINPEQSWFKGMWLMGQEPDNNNYHSFTLPCTMNKFISDQDILDAKSQLTDREFRMLYMGEWVDDEGSFFTDFDRALLPHLPNTDPRTRCVMGVDFAAVDDYNAVIVAETATKTCIARSRWNRTDPLTTYDRIAEIWERHNKPLVYCDATGLGGEAMMAELRDRGMRCVPVKFTSANKMEIYTRLASDLEHRRIMFPEDWDDVIRELKGFVYQKTPSGRITARAAAGFHDDMVAALALTNEGLRARGGSGSQSQYSYLPEKQTSESKIKELLGIRY